MRNNTSINWEEYTIVDQLSLCIQHKNMTKFKYILQNNPDIDLNAKCTLGYEKGYTLFLISIGYVNPSSMEILLNHNVNIYLKSDDDLDFVDTLYQELSINDNNRDLCRIQAYLLKYMLYREEHSTNKEIFIKLIDVIANFFKDNEEYL